MTTTRQRPYLHGVLAVASKRIIAAAGVASRKKRSCGASAAGLCSGEIGRRRHSVTTALRRRQENALLAYGGSALTVARRNGEVGELGGNIKEQPRAGK